MNNPLTYNKINAIAGRYNPSMVKSYNNQAFAFWERSLFQRAQSVIKEEGFPDEWSGSVKDFFYYCMLSYGFVSVFQSDVYGLSFQPATFSGFNFYYQPTHVLISNPALKDALTLEIGTDTELLKLTPDYFGIRDIVSYYAEKLAVLDNAVNMSLINNKFAYFLGARNKGMAQALKKMLDKINRGEPAVVYDQRLMNDATDKDVPYQFFERQNLKESYITSDQLQDFQTILNSFDAEIGIPTVPYQKKERLVTDEANSKTTDAISRLTVWIDTLNESAALVNRMFNTGIKFTRRFDNMEGGADNGDNDADRTL